MNLAAWGLRLVPRSCLSLELEACCLLLAAWGLELGARPDSAVAGSGLMASTFLATGFLSLIEETSAEPDFSCARLLRARNSL